MSNNRVLSCIQPSGEMHLGNYFGAISNWVALQEKHECFYGIVDLHAMTLPYKSDALRANTERMIIDLLACGVNANTLFVQSLVPEHAELAWILGCVTSYGELSRQPQFKDKSEQADFVTSGLFTYPVLQAADILMYRAGLVPVGRDQRTHLELARNIVVRFNKQFGKTFDEPKPLFTEIPNLMSLADPTKKMSKSLGPNHYIGLFEDADSVRKKVRSAVTATASGGVISPGVENLLALLKACGKDEEYADMLEKETSGTLQYSTLKTAVADAIVDLTSPLIERRKSYLEDKTSAIDVVVDSSDRARQTAIDTMVIVREAVGVLSA
jgi:tryptophanyl-tRNA synthetase